MQLYDVVPWEVDSDLGRRLFSVSFAKSCKGTEKEERTTNVTGGKGKRTGIYQRLSDDEDEEEGPSL